MKLCLSAVQPKKGEQAIPFQAKTIIIHHTEVPLLIWIVLVLELDIVNILVLLLFRSYKN